MNFILYLFFSLFLSFFVHEFGHYFSAFIFGYKLKFRFSLGNLKVKKINLKIPRYIWDMPSEAKEYQKVIIALSGFIFEFLFSFLIYFINIKFFFYYSVVALFHLILYYFYAGECNDFNFLK